MTTPTPLLDFFKRGEVASDVRLLAASGGLAPRASEQIAILVFLLDDPDPEIRQTADGTISRIPEAALQSYLARPEVPIDIREFFADRGVFPAQIPDLVYSADRDEPLVEEKADDVPADEAPDKSTTAQIATMTFTQRLKAAMKGSREVRTVLIRDPNKMIAAAVLSSPKVSEQDIENYARMANVTEEVLRIIGNNRTWMKNYGVVTGLARNPKTPLALSLRLLMRLNDRDAQMLSMDRNVPGTLRIAARKRIVEGTKG